jgi:hypothetical protein
MQFKVPQFIDVEDKVVGPLTFKQFAYLAGGAGLIYLSLHSLPVLLGLPIAGIFGALAVALAFFKYNEKPFIHVLEAFIRFYTKSRLYLWHKEPKKEMSVAPQVPAEQASFNRASLTESKLKTLSWSLDVINPGTEEKK